MNNMTNPHHLAELGSQSFSFLKLSQVNLFKQGLGSVVIAIISLVLRFTSSIVW